MSSDAGIRRIGAKTHNQKMATDGGHNSGDTAAATVRVRVRVVCKFASVQSLSFAPYRYCLSSVASELPHELPHCVCLWHQSVSAEVELQAADESIRYTTTAANESISHTTPGCLGGVHVRSAYEECSQWRCVRSAASQWRCVRRAASGGV